MIWRKRSRAAVSRRACLAAAAVVAVLKARRRFAFSPYCCARSVGTRARRDLDSGALVAAGLDAALIETLSALVSLLGLPTFVTLATGFADFADFDGFAKTAFFTLVFFFVVFVAPDVGFAIGAGVTDDSALVSGFAADFAAGFDADFGADFCRAGFAARGVGIALSFLLNAIIDMSEITLSLASRRRFINMKFRASTEIL